MLHRHPNAKKAKLTDPLFEKACSLVEPKLNPSRRQESKWSQKRGAAYGLRNEAQRVIAEEAAEAERQLAEANAA